MKKSIYFPNLNGLRFFAALMVILHHFELARQISEISFYGRFTIEIGKLGVILFFTLSGFLITYLLLTEQTETGKIQIKNFYVRRILRIWPLYYFIVFGALYVFNNIMYFRIPGISQTVHHNFFVKNLLFIFMLPNIAYSFGYNLPFADQTWSIGVEEQFYLFWPFLLGKMKNKKKFILNVIVGYLSLKTFFFVLSLTLTREIFKSIYFLVSISSFDSMAFGAFAALLLFEKNGIIFKVLFDKNFQLAAYILLAVSILMGINLGLFQYEYFSILFGILIINLAGNKNVIFSLKNGVLNYLGKISFGLYMYHFLSIRFIDLLLLKIPGLNHWIQLVTVIGVTVLIASLSYELMEKYFIKKKIRFARIVSGDNALFKTNELG